MSETAARGTIPPRSADGTSEAELTRWLGLQRSAHAAFGRLVAEVSDWSAPTPDTEWDTRALVLHVVREQQWVPPLLAGRTPRWIRGRLDPLGADLVDEWRSHSAAALLAWSTANPDTRLTLVRDTVSTVDFLREQVSDVAVHTWDLARAIGGDERLDDDIVAAVWEVFAPQRDALEASGLFAGPVPVDVDAPLQTRLLALTGRDDRRPL